MFKKVVILVRVKKKKSAIKRVKDFLEPSYYNDWTSYKVVQATLLKDCLMQVRSVCGDTVALSEKAFETMLKSREREKTGGSPFNSAYDAHVYSLMRTKSFSFYCNVFDLEESVSEQLPEDIAGYWAVKVELFLLGGGIVTYLS